MKRVIMILALALFPMQAEAVDLPAVYAGGAYDSKVELTTAILSDVFGVDRMGLHLAVGALDRRGPCAGVSLDVDRMVKYARLDYKWLDKLKLATGPSYSLTEKDWSWFGFGAVISVDF